MKKILLTGILILACLASAWAQAPGDASASRVVIGGEYFYVHIVQPGETLYSLSRKYGVSQQEIVQENPLTAEGLRAGEAIKIPAPEPEPLPRNIRNRTTSNRRVEVHTVNPGETAYSIAKRYSVSVDNLIETNPNFDPAHLSIGQKIRIPRQIIGTATAAEIDDNFAQYTEALNDITDGMGYHLVEKGETLYSLSHQLNVPIDTLERYNRTELATGLKAGSMLKYPTASEPTEVDREPVVDAEDQRLYEPADPKTINSSAPLNVLLLLPFQSENQEDERFVEYYNGTLLALEEVKNNGTSVNLLVRNSKRSTQEVNRLLEELEPRSLDLIIGPVYEEPFRIAAQFAYQERIPIVSPLAAVNSHNPFVYQAAPDQNHKYDKLKALISPEKNILLILPATGMDEEFKNEITALLPAHVTRIPYARETSAALLEQALSKEKENLIVIPTSNENVTEEIMAKLSSIQNSTTARTGKSYPIQTIGSPQWARFTHVEKEYFFKLGVVYTTMYYADRTNPVVASFIRRYLTTFGKLPTLYSYRGYELAKIFVTALKEYGHRYASAINRVHPGLLQVPYRFTQEEHGKWINDQWVLVCYRNDYIIEVK